MIEWMLIHLTSIMGLFFVVLHIVGILTAIHAIMQTRTPQGAIAWALSLLIFPLIALPLYWIFGHNRFLRYARERHSEKLGLGPMRQNLADNLSEPVVFTDEMSHGFQRLAALTGNYFTQGNDARLLINGEATFAAIFAAIEQAKDYILLQFFIVHDDNLGQKLQQLLIQKAKQNIRIYFLFDGIGSHDLPDKFVSEMRSNGIQALEFKRSARSHRFELNFRNHRKIVVVDGLVAFTGGLNVGDEYLGLSEKFQHWRDTFVEIRGPAVQFIQLSFIEDWFWVIHQVPQLSWQMQSVKSNNQQILVLPTGPADKFEIFTLFLLHAIHSAKDKIYIVSPYFVPDQQIVSALMLASIRGVDVRILLPDKPDHLLVYLSSYSYVAEAEKSGVKFYRYLPGFLHQKVMLIDHSFATVGTGNLDNRSMRLNFEMTVLFNDSNFVAQIEAMMKKDFSSAVMVTKEEYNSKPFSFKLAVKISRLLAPVQ